MKNILKPWILAGYESFAKEGPQGLKVEVLARMVGKNKSSFYHHFADMEVFTSFLLTYHLERIEIIAEEESQCKNIDPEFFEVMLTYKEDLLFSRQLRIHRQVPAYAQCFQQANQAAVESILGIWAEALELEGDSHLAQMVLVLSMENFFLQITEETLNMDWLRTYIQQLQHMVRAFKDRKELLPLDGDV